MYTKTGFTKKSMMQQQFTRELNARLKQLSLKSECSESNERSERSSLSSSSPSSSVSSISLPRTSFSMHKNSSLKDKNFTKKLSNDLQKSNGTNLSHKNINLCQKIPIEPKSLRQPNDKKLYHEKKQFSKNEINSFDSKQQIYSKDNYIEINQANKSNAKSTFSPKTRPKSSESWNQNVKGRKKLNSADEYISRKTHRYDISSVRQDIDVDEMSEKTDYDLELECLEDDTVIIDDNKSTIDISDSDFSCTRQLSNLPEEILPPVIASLLPNTPSVLRFVDSKQTVPKLPKPYKYQLLWRPSAITPNVVKRVLRRSNFRITLKSNEWIGYYGNNLKPFGFRPVREYQKVNHFPGSFQLGRKDKLWLNLNHLRMRFGKKSIDFVPRTFCLPSDLKSLKEYWTQQENEHKNSLNNDALSYFRPKWIMKPPASARGIGIKLVRGWSDIPQQRRVIVQSYINQPYLIDGKKFDIRLYVLVSGFSPLRAYVYREGLVRFASQKYSTALQHLRNRFVHLTNYSINKYNKTDETFVSNHKWKLSTLWSYLTERGVDVLNLWSRIVDIIFKTLSSVVNCIATMVDQNCRRRASVYELFGFDIILDADLKPWLLEVNVSPSLHTNTKLDDEVKTAVVKDMFNICGFQLPPNYRLSLSLTTIPSKSQNTIHHQLNKNRNSSVTGRITSGSMKQPQNGNHFSMSCRNNNDNLSYNRKLSNNKDVCIPSSAFIRQSSAPLKTFMYKGISPVHGLPPSSPSLNSTHAKKFTVSTKTIFGKKIDEKGNASKIIVNNSNNINNNNSLLSNHNDRFSFDPYVPMTDPRLWDISLSAEDKRKHLFYSSLLIDKNKDKSSQIFNRLSKHNMKNPTTGTRTTTTTSSRASIAEKCSKDPMDALHHILLELSPDDLRTLVNLIDERYRAALGNFQCIFPIHGSKGYRMLKFLQGAYQDHMLRGGTLGSRSPSFYYYDLLHYVFLTVYHNTEGNDNFSCDSFVHCSYDKILPDQVALISNELNDESLSIASEMTGVSMFGLKCLINLCKEAAHLSNLDNPMKSSQSSKTQGDTKSKTSNFGSNKIDLREYNETDDSISLVYQNSSCSTENQYKYLNNVSTIYSAEKCSNQTQTITQCTRENNTENLRLHHEHDSHNKSSSWKTKRVQSSLKNIKSIQTNIKSNNRNCFGSMLSIKNTSTNFDNCTKNAVTNTKAVNAANNTLKGSTSISDISSDKKQTNLSSLQVQTSNWDENIFTSSDDLMCTLNNSRNLSCEPQTTKNMDSVKYSTTSSSLSSSSITTVASTNSPKCYYGYHVLQRMNSKRICESPDEMYDFSQYLTKNDKHTNERTKKSEICLTDEQLYTTTSSSNGTINDLKNKRHKRQLSSEHQGNMYTDGMLNNHRRYHRIKSTTSMRSIIKPYSQDRKLCSNNKSNHGTGSYEEVSLQSHSSGYSSFIRDKLNSSYGLLPLEIQKAQKSS
ncbi:unnamed protein product [Schistosoma turkestanicum]|nr:unnamed protein product [Schistosoma turkestanicum]